MAYPLQVQVRESAVLLSVVLGDGATVVQVCFILFVVFSCFVCSKGIFDIKEKVKMFLHEKREGEAVAVVGRGQGSWDIFRHRRPVLMWAPQQDIPDILRFNSMRNLWLSAHLAQRERERDGCLSERASLPCIS